MPAAMAISKVQFFRKVLMLIFLFQLEYLVA